MRNTFFLFMFLLESFGETVERKRYNEFHESLLKDKDSGKKPTFKSAADPSFHQEFPFVAQIHANCNGKDGKCGGSLVSQHIILTAANCVKECKLDNHKDFIKVQIGAKSAKKSGANLHDAKVTEVIIYSESGNGDLTTQKGAPALLSLDRLQYYDKYKNKVLIPNTKSRRQLTRYPQLNHFGNLFFRSAVCKDTVKSEFGGNVVCVKSAGAKPRALDLADVDIGSPMIVDKVFQVGMKLGERDGEPVVLDLSPYKNWILDKTTTKTKDLIQVHGDPDDVDFFPVIE